MKRWIPYSKKSNNIIEQLLINRKIKDKESFLNPDYDKDIIDPFLLHDMKKAVKRIISAIKNKEKIGIFADYDADGIPGAAILANFFNFIGIKTEVYIPSREEGYGLSENGIGDLANAGSTLIITVDLGITGKKEVNFAKKTGIDIIVTDHHLFKKNQLPKDAAAIIHPKLSPQYPNKDLSGGGVAWKLVEGVVSDLKPQNFHLGSIESRRANLKNILKWSLDLAAISTVCDIVPLVGENRTITKFGLKVLAKTKNIGLEELMREASIKLENISVYTLGFQIGPRLNAPGRLNHAQISYYLLTTRNRRQAKELAEKLNHANQQRQEELKRVLIEAREKIKKRGLGNKKIILIEDKNWPEGLIGLVAGKLMDELCRPVIVFREENKCLKGSARSTQEFHILEALDLVSKYLTKHGGHARAAGLSLEKEHLSILYDKLLEIAEHKLKSEDLLPKISIDAEINPEEITLKLCQDLKKFEPYGLGNPRPLFLCNQLVISDKRTVGAKKNHLKLSLRSLAQAQSASSNSKLQAIGFDLGYLYDKLKEDDKVNIVFSLDTNEWDGVKKVQLKIMDIKLCQKKN